MGLSVLPTADAGQTLVPCVLRSTCRQFRPPLAEDGDAFSAFDGMSYSNRKEYVDWIESARRAGTRARRIARAVTMVGEGRRLK